MRRLAAAGVVLCSLVGVACDDESTTTIESTETSVEPVGDVVVRIELDRTQVQIGTPIAGVLAFENIGEPISVLRDGCMPLWTVALGNDNTPPQADFTAPCITEFTIGTGRSEFPFTVYTRLQPGTYQAVLVTDDGQPLGGPAPNPVTVTLTE